MDLRQLIARIASTYDAELDTQSEAQRLLRGAHRKMAAWLPDSRPDYVVKGSGGQGSTAFVPWIAIFNEKETTSAQNGVYVVYLFVIEYGTVILSLNQGSERLVKRLGTRAGRAKMETFSKNIRDALPAKAWEGLEETILLPDSAQRPKRYQYGNILAHTYKADGLPSVEVMKSDLDHFLTLYDLALDAKRHLSAAGREMPITPNAPTTPTRQVDFQPAFKPKNNADYEQFIHGGLIQKGRTHETLLEQYGHYLDRCGFIPATNVHPRDMLALRDDITWLIEIKIVRGGKGMDAAREALGQLLAYRYLHHNNNQAVQLVAVFNETVGGLSVGLLDAHKIAVVWRHDHQWWGTQRAFSDRLCEAVNMSA
ncbi:MrcB family domain-containing protein [Nonomuraea sp. NPDC050451]|uniref:MrcB family domain-containing protein n=1 Tax=Nonomuraea sp. NPDC050451 TaxID=3364364 RepID=UPI0037B099DA